MYCVILDITYLHIFTREYVYIYISTHYVHIISLSLSLVCSDPLHFAVLFVLMAGIGAGVSFTGGVFAEVLPLKAT